MAKKPQTEVEIGEHRLVVPHSVYYSVLEPDADRETKVPLLIVLHGYGQRAEKFIAQFMPMRDAGTLVVAPQGPNAFYWQRNGGVGFAWITRHHKEQALSDLLGYMRLLFNDLSRAYTVDTKRVYVLGFSQGSVLAFRVAAAGITKLRGLIACGADLPEDVEARLGDMERMPVMVVHGRDDDIMPVAKSDEAAATLEIHGFPVTRHFYEGGHELRPGDIEAIRDWIGEH